MIEKLERSELLLILAVSFFAITGGVALALNGDGGSREIVDPVHAGDPYERGIGPLDASTWFQSVRQHCNPVEVETYMEWQPGTPGSGRGHVQGRVLRSRGADR